MEATTAVIWLTLITTIGTPTSDNVTDAGIDYNVSSSPSHPSSPSSSSRRYSYVSPTVTMVFYVASTLIAVVGFLANTYVLLALLLSKNSHGSNVNVFITHQTVLDLTACAFLVFGIFANLWQTKMNDSLALFVCWFFQTFSIASTAGNASVCGLMIITIERYVKIVHPVAHRNHYRPWMTRVGIVLPWIFGICTDLIPAWATSKVVRGVCFRRQKWSNGVYQLVWSVVKFLLLYVGPLFVFVFGYGKILAAIRRQRMQVEHSHPQGTSNATTTDKSSRRTEMNVIRTMVVVAVSFALCFACWQFYTILTRLGVPSSGEFRLIFSVFAYGNRCLNPFIYATQYDVVRRWWRVVVCRAVRGQHADDAPSTMPDGPRHQQTTTIHVTSKNI